MENNSKNFQKNNKDSLLNNNFSSGSKMKRSPVKQSPVKNHIINHIKNHINNLLIDTCANLQAHLLSL